MAHVDWVWVPHRYIWTPRGCIFVAGYWDYPLVRRGLPFCPVYFHRPVYRTAGYYFTPGVVINVGRVFSGYRWTPHNERQAGASLASAVFSSFA